MHQVAVLARDHDGAERTIRRVLEEHLGGGAGVVAAFLAAGGQAYGVGSPPSAAARPWRDAELAALDAAHLEFPALVLRLDGEDLDEALAEEFVSIEPLQITGPATAADATDRSQGRQL
ncbi:hypothetical protein CS062_16285 [Roseateles chitinivorans]|uniref:Uncharacterized protein n=2 Tax=Roseateles chitinivorans TaxID=2917965 RepID=A0A2G9C6Z3_9BURK|nr:hypothetical protein CS062_16285 [Roseateles chitinivorans]